MSELFLGHTPQYWLELDLRMKKEYPFDAPRMLEEIVVLMGKIRFYESRINEMYSQVKK